MGGSLEKTQGLCLSVGLLGRRKKCCFCRCVPCGRRAPELLCQRAMLSLQQVCTLRVHSWVCMCAPMSAPVHGPVRVVACLQGQHGHTCLCNAVGISDQNSIPTRATPCVQPGVLPGCAQVCVVLYPPARGPRLRWSWCLARPRLTLLEPVGTVWGSFNLMKCEAFYGLLITW